jgi:hypothetical protein
MKSIYLLLTLLAVLTNGAMAQRSCATMDYMKMKNEAHGKPGEQLRTMNSEIEKWLSDHAGELNNRDVITIPVVVHVVYKTSTQNISDSQVLSQIDVLNQDFRRLNDDTSNTPSAFQSVAADPEIEFCMAQADPEGNPTNGIVRVSTTHGVFSLDDDVKFTSLGGSDAWDTDHYFNIWVCDLGAFLLGYAEFPQSAYSSTYGVVINYNAFGTEGTADPPFDRGRTATHEVGHAFSLYHIWGDDGNSCTGSDLVSDTPNQADEHYFCASFPSISCSNGPDGDMFMNYMDYSDDDCMNLFTTGQSDRMSAAINLYNSSMIGTDVCTPIVLAPGNVALYQILQPTGGYCQGEFIPQVEVRNYGTTDLTSVDVNYAVDNNPVTTFSWTGLVPSLGSVNILLNQVTGLSDGSHTFTVYTSNPNGAADPDPSNDTAQSIFTVSSVGIVAPISQGFESLDFPPAYWQLSNPDGSTTWERTTQADHSGSGSMFINNYDYAANGEIDEFISTPLDISSLTNPTLTFWVAYRLYTNPNAGQNWSDTLSVFASDNCGDTWTLLYKKFSEDLTTAVPSYSTTFFIPTASQWREETVSLGSFAGAASLLVKFRNTTDYENNLYIDDINIDVGTSAEILHPQTYISIFPNPGNGLVTIEINGTITSEKIQAELFDLTGKIAWSGILHTGMLNNLYLDVVPGVYSLRVQNSQFSLIRQLIIQQ